MLKKSASFVLVGQASSLPSQARGLRHSLKASTYRTEYASARRSLRPRWTAFLSILRGIPVSHGISCFCSVVISFLLVQVLAPFSSFGTAAEAVMRAGQTPEEPTSREGGAKNGEEDTRAEKDMREAEIARTNHELQTIQRELLEELKSKGIVPPKNMVLIPAGVFTMGVKSGGLTNIQPAHRVYVDAYWIDRFPVTNAEYKTCVEAGVCRPPVHRPMAPLTRSEYYDAPEFSDFPVNYVRWEHAATYCQWAGKRLPTEAEWEKAARSDDERLYAWGDELPEGFLAWEPLWAVGTHPELASPYGVMDMGGSIWEWVADSYGGDYYANSPLVNPEGPEALMTKVKRGGDRFIVTPWAILRSPEYANDSNATVGFRCAKDLVDPAAPSSSAEEQ